LVKGREVSRLSSGDQCQARREGRRHRVAALQELGAGRHNIAAYMAPEQVGTVVECTWSTCPPFISCQCFPLATPNQKPEGKGGCSLTCRDCLPETAGQESRIWEEWARKGTVHPVLQVHRAQEAQPLEAVLPDHWLAPSRLDVIWDTSCPSGWCFLLPVSCSLWLPLSGLAPSFWWSLPLSSLLRKDVCVRGTSFETFHDVLILSLCLTGSLTGTVPWRK
jgi:hypothetical protein